MKGLTARQSAMLRAIADHQRDHGRPPTIRELGRALGIRSTNGVNDHLRALEAKGYLRRDPTVSRGLVLTSPADRWPSLADEIARLESDIQARQRALDALRLRALVGPDGAEDGPDRFGLGRGRADAGKAGKVSPRSSKRHGESLTVEGAR